MVRRAETTSELTKQNCGRDLVDVNGVGVEKLEIHKNSMILRDGKSSDAPYKAFIGHPDATLF
jgi:hypothetical protein